MNGVVGASPSLRSRSPVMVLILTLITCGLYGLVWMWQVGSELRDELQLTDQNPGLDVLLTILTATIWGWVVVYRYAREVAEAQKRAGVPPSDLSLASLILAVLGLWCVSFALLQTELNKVWAAKSGAPVPIV